MRSIICRILIGASVVLLAQQAYGGGVSEADFRAFLADYTAKIIPLNIESNRTYFDAAISGKDED